jgi:hypothetical protein
MGFVGSVSGITVALLLVLSLVSGTFVPPATAQSSDDPPAVSISVERRPADHGVVQYRLDFETPEDARQFWLINYTGNVVSSEGFVTDRTKNGNHAVRWDGDTESPSVTITTDLDSKSGREFAATDEWTLASTPRVSVAWQADGGDDWQYFHPLRDEYPDRSVSFTDAGVLGSAFTYVGKYDEHVRHVDGQTVRMVVASGASPEESPADVFDALGSASKRLPGRSPDDVLLFVLPDPIWRGGYASPKYDELWVHEDARLDDPQNLWLHEYVHTRQSFELGDRMKWFREASAAYFASALAMQQGRTSKSAVVDTLSSKEYRNSVLSKSDTWANREVPYYRGALTLWALDDEIRRATDGERTLMDVFDRMNRRNESIGYTDFREIVAEVAGRSLAPWMDKHVTATARLDPSQLQKRSDMGSNVGAAAGGSDGNDEAGHRSGGEDGVQPPATIESLPSTLVLWGCLGLVGLVFGLTAAQFISGTVSRFRGKK